MISAAAAPIKSNQRMAQTRLPIAVQTSASARLDDRRSQGTSSSGVILPEEIGDDDGRGDGAAPIERRRPARLAADEGERQPQPQTHRQQLFGIKAPCRRQRRGRSSTQPTTQTISRPCSTSVASATARDAAGFVPPPRPAVDAVRSLQSRRLDVMLFVIFQRARMIRDVVILVGDGSVRTRAAPAGSPRCRPCYLSSVSSNL